MSTKPQQLDEEALLKKHQLHEGLYARVARKLHVDPSYVSRVAHGDRHSEKILKALIEELRRIERR